MLKTITMRESSGKLIKVLEISEDNTVRGRFDFDIDVWRKTRKFKNLAIAFIWLVYGWDNNYVISFENFGEFSIFQIN